MIVLLTWWENGAIEEGVSAPDERVLAALGHAVEPKEPLGVALWAPLRPLLHLLLDLDYSL
jgi:hypothetical protein